MMTHLFEYLLQHLPGTLLTTYTILVILVCVIAVYCGPKKKLKEKSPMSEWTGCPCCYTTPCHPRCTCVHGASSTGCYRCCSYGSVEQRTAKAKFLAPIIDAGLGQKRLDKWLETHPTDRTLYAGQFVAIAEDWGTLCCADSLSEVVKKVKYEPGKENFIIGFIPPEPKADRGKERPASGSDASNNPVQPEVPK